MRTSTFAVLCFVLSADFAPAQTTFSSQQSKGLAGAFAFPSGSVVACVNLPKVASASKTGAAAFAKLRELGKVKSDEVAKRAKELDALRLLIAQPATVPDDPKRLAAEKTAEKAQVDLERFRQDAQAEIQELQMNVEQDFQLKVFPIVEAIGKEKGIHFIFNATAAGFVWFEDAVDISDEVIRRLDALMPPK